MKLEYMIILTLQLKQTSKQTKHILKINSQAIKT